MARWTGQSPPSQMESYTIDKVEEHDDGGMGIVESTKSRAEFALQ